MKSTTSGPLRALLALVLSAALLLPGAASASAGSKPSVGGSGAIVMDCQTGEVYYEKNADTPRPAASMTKLMSVYLVFEEIAAGNLSLDSYVTASAYAAGISNNRAYSGLERLKTGGRYQVDTLLRLIMTASCNGSVIVLAEHIGGTEAAFVQRMNDKAAEWGIQAKFADCCGFEDQGNAVTPRAMAVIAQTILTDYPQILEYSSLSSTSFQGKTFASTNTLLRSGACPGIDGLKSGTTSGAGYCFTGTASRDGRRIISVVMNSTSYSARMNDTKRLLEYGFACRTEREKAWAAAAQKLEASVSLEGEYLWPYVDNTLTASFTGLSAELPCSLSWELNGAPIGAEAMPVTLREDTEVQVLCTPPAGETALTATLILTLPNGEEIRREVPVPGTAGELSFTGRLGMTEVTMYPEGTLTVPLQVKNDQDLSLAVSAGWYLDGAPIPNYQNDAFQLEPNGSSAYTLQGESLTPGTHTLEFRCNTQALPGIQQASFPLELTVLRP